MSAITLAKAKEVFARTATVDNSLLLDKISEAIEFLLINGGGDILHEWDIKCKEGRVTLPTDLGTPIKYKFGRDANLGYGTFNTPYFSYGSNSYRDSDGYFFWDMNIEQKSNRVFTQFRPPVCGVRILATVKKLPYYDICPNTNQIHRPQIQVNGKYRGFDIATQHFGNPTAGEVLNIYEESDNKKKYSSFYFDEITGIFKDYTFDQWVTLSGIDKEGKVYFLSHYHPDDTNPSYKEIEIFSSTGAECCEFTLHVVGRINPNIKYTRDEQVLPIWSLTLLNLLAKRCNYLESGEFKLLSTVEDLIKVHISKSNPYKESPKRNMSFNLKSTRGGYSTI
jgi:hypothetical protein